MSSVLDFVSAPYQLFPSLTDDEYQALKADIAERGVLVPVEKDEHGNILDGHHRVQAWEELKAEGVDIAPYPVAIRYSMTEAQKRNHVRALNYLRRHMGKEQRAQVFVDMRRDGMTLQEIADVAGVGIGTVHRTLGSSDFPNGNSELPQTITSANGKERPTSYKPRVQTPTLFTSEADDTERPLEGVSGDVVAMMTRYSITDPELIPRLQHAHANNLETWSTIVLTGTLDGERPIGRVSPTEFDDYLERKAYEHRAAGAATSSKPHVAHNAGNNEWYTPSDYIRAARRVMGSIDVDPASSLEANENVKAARFYTAEDDGLLHPWWGNVWMNPPYAADLIGKFCTRLRDHVLAGNVKQACVLVNNATETAWFQELAKVSAAVCFPSRRVRFWEPGGALSQPLQGQAVLYIGPNRDAFRETFGSFGFVAVLP